MARKHTGPATCRSRYTRRLTNSYRPSHNSHSLKEAKLLRRWRAHSKVISLAWTSILASLLAASSAARPTDAAAKERSEADARKLADRVLERAIIIDTHADTPQMMLDEGYDLADRSSPYMVSIPKMRDGHLGAEFFSIWVSVD